MTIPELTLTELSELLPHTDAATIIGKLAERGCAIELPQDGWNPLAGGREYHRPESDPVKVDGVHCRLVVEMSRTRGEADGSMVDALELHPSRHESSQQDDEAWRSAIRALLTSTFELVGASPDGVEVYHRGSIEKGLLLRHPSSYLLLHLRPQFRE